MLLSLQIYCVVINISQKIAVCVWILGASSLSSLPFPSLPWLSFLSHPLVKPHKAYNILARSLTTNPSLVVTKTPQHPDSPRKLSPTLRHTHTHTHPLYETLLGNAWRTAHSISPFLTPPLAPTPHSLPVLLINMALCGILDTRSLLLWPMKLYGGVSVFVYI